MANESRDEIFMGRALELARRAWGETHPNPMVGAVIVEDDGIVAEGWHARDGGPHAERVALAVLGRAPKQGASLVVTLEPCSTEGRTGSCTEAIIASGIRRVVAGATDPNPDHAGRGYDQLRAAGIEVVSGVLGCECEDLNLIFNHWITRKQPMFAAKVATTLDGKIACRSGESKWISNEQSRADVMRWRRLFPGIAVGAGTVAKDNPRLTARIEGMKEWSPWRFVFDGLLRSVVDRNTPDLFTDEFRERTIVVTTPHGGQGYVRKLEASGAKVWMFDSPNQRVPLGDFRKRCAAENICGVYFEGGVQLLSELLQERQLDYLFMYRAPMLFADDKAKAAFTGLRTEKLANAVRIVDVRHETFSDDMLSRGRVQYPEVLQVDEAAFRL
ncbi:MAG: bifunctional diaminohydroxyphosphoribosylaminopyrimidine deaminase/5-amino-6-(5-phosphoribosylamino)uracil reductase RibD [Opitutaceae bacterium]|jgi:diaminohydroxyphosphoribosylaminopyrimidine deaminase/5-amino-6-(5-phosphoribosylamino)uracil reductase